MLSVASANKASALCAKPPRILSVRRRQSVFVAARSKQEIDAEFEAQQQLLAFRRQKAEARMNPGAAPSAKGPTVKAATAKGATTKGKPAPAPAAKSSIPIPKDVVVDESEDFNPLGFLGKLFGKK